MKVYFSDPKRQIAALKPLLSSRADLLAVRCFSFEAEPEGLYITATDLEVGLRIFHPAQVVKPGKAIVPESVVDLLEGEEVMSLSADEKALSVRCGDFTRQRPILDAGLWPGLAYITSEVLAEYRTGVQAAGLPADAWDGLAVLSLTTTESAFALSQAHRLGAGEHSCLAVAVNRDALLVTDDRVARKYVQKAGCGSSAR